MTFIVAEYLATSRDRRASTTPRRRRAAAIRLLRGRGDVDDAFRRGGGLRTGAGEGQSGCGLGHHRIVLIDGIIAVALYPRLSLDILLCTIGVGMIVMRKRWR